MRVFYLHLEGYKERYTELLTTWTVDRFTAHGIEVVLVTGDTLSEGIKVGSVLDAHGRSYFALTQIAALVKMLATMSSEDWIYIDDMFTPGYEALPYILHQVEASKRPKIIARNHAQSVDIDDFTFPMRSWMGHYEELVANTAHAIICGSTIHAEIMRVVGWKCPVYTLGLPFDKTSVQTLAGAIPAWENKRVKVIYSSRWDIEKQPWIFCEIVERLHNKIEFVVCTGSKELRGLRDSVNWALQLEAEGKLKIIRNATKPMYYQELASSRVQFNCARQDFVSYTMLEASALGTASVLPCFRSFPEAMEGTDRKLHLYTPFDIEHACELIEYWCASSTPPKNVEAPATHHHKMLDRLADYITTTTSKE